MSCLRFRQKNVRKTDSARRGALRTEVKTSTDRYGISHTLMCEEESEADDLEPLIDVEGVGANPAPAGRT
jgi:hypothetical protein